MGHPFRETVDLVRRARGGDHGALNRLLDRYQARVRGLVRARLGPALRRGIESSDAVQEVMVDVLRGIDRFEMRDEDAFVRWLGRIVENRLRRQARHLHAARRDRGREVPLGGSGSRSGRRAPDPANPDAGPAELAERRELVKRVTEAEATLELRQREVLRKRRGGASWSEVAAAMDFTSAEAARLYHFRAKTALLRAASLAEGDAASE